MNIFFCLGGMLGGVLIQRSISACKVDIFTGKNFLPPKNCKRNYLLILPLVMCKIFLPQIERKTSLLEGHHREERFLNSRARSMRKRRTKPKATALKTCGKHLPAQPSLDTKKDPILCFLLTCEQRQRT